MNILFLDQSGKPGGAELCLLDVAIACGQHSQHCRVGLFEDGSFRQLLEQYGVPVTLLGRKSIRVRKQSGILAGLQSAGLLLPLVLRVVALAKSFDLIYANTQKALVVGAIASALSDRPLVYHLHDILSPEHFSLSNRKLAIALANRAQLVIANSKASREAFLAAGGRADLVQVVYNGFAVERYRQRPNSQILRSQLNLEGRFVVGHFSRLSPWKGQHVLLEALKHCDRSVVALIVGDALFGEQDYVDQLKAAAAELPDRVQFLGFRSDVIELMHLCDLVVHSSTAAEPFGRVIVESMLCGKPTIASQAGGALELIESGVTGWSVVPGDASALAQAIENCRTQPDSSYAIAQAAQAQASQRFDLETTNQQILSLLHEIK